MGRIGRAHGTRGAVVIDPHTDDPATRFAPGSVVTLDDGTSLTIRRYEATQRSPVVTFAEVGERARAESLRGRLLFVAVGDRRQLAEDEFWPDELVGLEVVSVDGTILGTVADVETGLSQDRLIVETDREPIIVPLVSALVPVVDVAGRRVVVDLPPGFND